MAVDEARRKVRESQHRARPEAQPEVYDGPPDPPRVEDPWDPPVPLEQKVEPPPPFPLDALPGPVHWFAAEVGRAAHVAPDYAAASCLSIAAAATGATARLHVKDDWSEQPSLFVGLVGDSSEKKTPSMGPARKPLDEEHRRRLKVKEERDKTNRRRRRQAKAIGLDGDDDDEATPYANDEGELVTTNCTIEGLARLFRRQRRGIAYVRSELRGWLDGLNQYRAGGKGDERQNFLELYDGGAIDITRSKGTTHIAGCCLNILGGVQPAAIAPFFQSRDGLAARFLWVYPPGRTAVPEDWATVDPRLRQAWGQIVARLMGRQMIETSQEDLTVRLEPEWFEFDAEARDEWVRYSTWLAGEQNDRERGPVYREFAGKLEGVGARLAVTLRCLAEAAGEPRPFRLVTGEDVHHAAELARYFAAMARRVYAAAGVDPRLEGARQVLEWVKRNRKAEFTRAELWASFGRNRTEYARPEDLHQPVNLLVAYHLVRWKDTGYFGVGRKPTPKWEVHPEVVKEFKG